MPSHPPAVSMQAAVITAPRQISLQTQALCQPGPQQLRIRLEGCGLCVSNLPVWEGREWFNYPCEAGAPGHEGWGYVDAVGSDVSQFKPGDRVAALSYHAFAEYDIADASNTVLLPGELQMQSIPIEPLDGCESQTDRRSGTATSSARTHLWPSCRQTRTDPAQSLNHDQ